MSTTVVTIVWAIPIIIALIYMRIYYRSPSEAELVKYDQMQPDEAPPTPEELAKRQEQ